MSDSGIPVFDPERLLRSLVDGDVDFVLIGGWAAKLHGSPTVTADIDICYSKDPDNLERLAAALAPLELRLRGIPDIVPFVLDQRTLLAGDMFTLSSIAGDIDLIGSPAGSSGFETLLQNADILELDDLRVPVASLDHLIAMKTAAGRPKDLIELEVLAALKDELEG
jgi:hypothetical protein